MTNYFVPVYSFPFGTRVFIHDNGVIREVEYRGMTVKDTGICGRNLKVEYIFWFGKDIRERKVTTATIYRTAKAATMEVDRVPVEILGMRLFSLKHLPHLMWDGIRFYGWIWDGSRPVEKPVLEYLMACEIRKGKVTFIDYNKNEYDADRFRCFYQTPEICRAANKPKVVMLDEDQDNTEEMMYKEFYEYIKSHYPDIKADMDREISILKGFNNSDK